MLIFIFLGIFGMWMAFLTVVQLYRHDLEKKSRVKQEIPLLEAPSLNLAPLKPSSKVSENSAFSLAVKELWNEILKGA